MNIKIIKFLSSLKLAVLIMLTLATIIAAGTIVESRYDATAAKKWVYDTWFMYLIMGMLATSLIAVMVDRWPWKKRHTPFVMAHIGILTLMLGSLITMKFGVDGTMRVGIGQKNQFLTIPQTEVEVWSSFNGDSFTKLFSQPVDFFINPPEKYPLQFQTDAGLIKISAYHPYAVSSRKVVATDDIRAGSAIRFQLKNTMANFSDWVVQKKPGDRAVQNLGPAQVILGPSNIQDKVLANQIVVTPSENGKLKYQVHYKDPNRKTQSGIINEGEVVQTGWMGLEFRLLRYMPKAEDTWDYQILDRPTPMTSGVITVEFQGKTHSLQQDDVLKVFTDRAAYLVIYAQKRIPLGFELQLKEFEVGRYQGTMRAASYASQVAVPGLTESATISMNEPLKHMGFTVYQASFQDGPDGKPVASIFSVNHDPGRWLKYLGCLIISLGTILLFYMKRKTARAQAPLAGAIE
jgi:hypothetical protein